MRYLSRTNATSRKLIRASSFTACWTRRLGNSTLSTKFFCLFTASEIGLYELANTFCNVGPGLQRELNCFADACDSAGMKISTAKTEELHLSRNPDQCVLQVNGATLKQVENLKYLGVASTSDGWQDKELDT